MLCGAQIKQACEASLRRLQTSYIDIYLIHCEGEGCGHACVYVVFVHVCDKGPHIMCCQMFWGALHLTDSPMRKRPRRPHLTRPTPVPPRPPRAGPARYAPTFGKRRYRPEQERECSSFEEQVEAMGQLIKVRARRRAGLFGGPGAAFAQPRAPWAQRPAVWRAPAAAGFFAPSRPLSIRRLRSNRAGGQGARVGPVQRDHLWRVQDVRGGQEAGREAADRHPERR